MSLIVQKYGGSSVANTDRIRNVAKRVAKFRKEGHDVVVVLSAMSGETNRLIGLATDIQEYPDPRELDMIVSTGEQVSIGLLAMALKTIGCDAISYCGWQLPFSTDCAHTKARISHINDEKIQKNLKEGKVVIVAGFQGINEHNDITTLGRGGSDTSAVALASALNADECQIYTDVDGVYTTDPRIVPEAKRLKTVTFEEMLELASLGSKVLQIRSVELAGKHNVRLRVLSSLLENPGEGTMITYEEDCNMEKAVVAGIAYEKNDTRINVKNVPDVPGVAYQILGPISDANIEIDMIVQNQAKEGTTDFSFTIPRSETHKAITILNKLKETLGESIAIDSNDDVAKVSVVGVGMRSHTGVAATMFKALADEGINIQIISTSEIKISVLIEQKYMELAIRVLHKAYKLDK